METETQTTDNLTIEHLREVLKTKDAELAELRKQLSEIHVQLDQVLINHKTYEL